MTMREDLDRGRAHDARRSRQVFLLLAIFVALNGCNDRQSDSHQVTISTPSGDVVAHESVVKPTPQRIATVTGDRLTELRALAECGPAFVEAYLPEIKDPGLKDYDRAFRAWQISQKKAHSDKQVIEILGGVLGNKCVNDLEMEWVTVSDEIGTNFAIRSRSGEAMGFPFSTVMKRIDDNEYDFMYAVFYTIKHSISEAELRSRDTTLAP